MGMKEDALRYHASEPRGKIFTGLKKPLETQNDLVFAYSPGVAIPCLAIEQNRDDSFCYTGRANLVGVVSNGSAVLGLGNIGSYAAKPVMEGKAMLFKKYADIDVFDIELDIADPDKFIESVKALEPTFGGINLEDIKSPECFYIEERLRQEMSIPVFHDDQHGTAIIVAAAFLNALEITGRDIIEVRIVFSGAGAAAIACAKLLLHLGVKLENILLCDRQGVIHAERPNLPDYKEKFARRTDKRSLADALVDADMFLGVSVANILTQKMLKKMAKNPIIFALANPDPEIHPHLAIQARPDAIIATGRSDFPNQVNNVLGFPFIFRGALDVQATTINEEMKLAAVKAIANLAKKGVTQQVMEVYQSKVGYCFGKDYLIPKPVDSRVLLHVAPAVAQAAMETGVARKKINMEDYIEQISRILGPKRTLIRKLRQRIKNTTLHSRQPRLVLTQGYDPRILKAAAEVLDEKSIHLTLLGSADVIEKQAKAHGLSQLMDKVCIVDPQQFDRIDEYTDTLFHKRLRRGVSRSNAEQLIRNPDYFAAIMVTKGEADGMLSGLAQSYPNAVRPILGIIGTDHHKTLAGVFMIMARKKLYFFADCTINISPTSEDLANIAIATAQLAKRYYKGMMRVALLSFSSFGDTSHPEAKKISKAVLEINRKAPFLKVDGEIQADIALSVPLQDQEFPFCKLKGEANILIFPDLNSANISYKLLINMSNAKAIGPILLGVNKPANVLQRSATVEEVIHMIYITADQTTRM